MTRSHPISYSLSPTQLAYSWIFSPSSQKNQGPCEIDHGDCIFFCLLFFPSSCCSALVPFDVNSFVRASICVISLYICFPCSWFVSVRFWHKSTMDSFLVAIWCIFSCSSLHVSLSSSNMSLMLSSEVTFLSLMFAALSNPFFSVAFLCLSFFS